MYVQYILCETTPCCISSPGTLISCWLCRNFLGKGLHLQHSQGQWQKAPHVQMQH